MASGMVGMNIYNSTRLNKKIRARGVLQSGVIDLGTTGGYSTVVTVEGVGEGTGDAVGTGDARRYWGR